MSNPNKIHYPRGYTSVGGVQFNPKIAVGAILVIFSLYAVYKYGQFAAEKSFNMSTDSPRGVGRVEHLSWLPRVFYHHSFLSDSEIASLLAGTSNSTTRGDIKVFQGQGAWFDTLQKRIARFTQEPIGNFETGFFTQYESGQDKPMRRDWFNADESALQGPRGNRVATLIMFLTNPKGAEISFPKANLKVTPRLGDALLVWNLTPDHRVDETTYYQFQKIEHDLTTYSVFIRERS